MEEEIRFLGSEGNASVLNVSYKGIRYQLSPSTEKPFEDFERQVPDLVPWGNSVKKAIEEMEKENKDIGECKILLASIGQVRYDEKNPEKPPEMQFCSPFSEVAPFLLTTWIEMKPEYKNDKRSNFKFSLKRIYTIRKL